MSGQLPLGDLGYGSPGHTGAPGAGYPQQGNYQYQQQPQPYYAQESRPSGGPGGGSGPRQPKKGDDSSGLALKILGLVAVAVVSGFAFWFFSGKSPSGGAHQSTPPPTTSVAPAGKYPFKPVNSNPFRDSDCSQHSNGQVQK